MNSRTVTTSYSILLILVNIRLRETWVVRGSRKTAKLVSDTPKRPRAITLAAPRRYRYVASIYRCECVILNTITGFQLSSSIVNTFYSRGYQSSFSKTQTHWWNLATQIALLREDSQIFRKRNYWVCSSQIKPLQCSINNIMFDIYSFFINRYWAGCRPYSWRQFDN